MYHLKEANIKVSPEWLRQKSESADLLTILKGWWSKGQFRSKPTNTEWKTSKIMKDCPNHSNLAIKSIQEERWNYFPG